MLLYIVTNFKLLDIVTKAVNPCKEKRKEMPYILPKNPKFRIFEDVLQIFVNFPDEAISSDYFKSYFQLNDIRDATRWLIKLHTWGLIKQDRIKDGKKYFIVTPWGKKFMTDRKAKLAKETAKKEKETKE